jgi:ATP-dependent Clp protease ATP-binding subunit ClpC
MEDRFSDRARAALVQSRDEAIRLGHDVVGTEHLLLGVLDEGGPPARVLRNLGVNTQRLRQAVEAAAPPPTVEPGEVWQGEGGLTAEAEAALKRAERAAGDARIEAEHVLLGLVGEESGAAVRVLRDTFGVTAAAVRDEVRRLRGESVEADQPPGAEAVRDRPASAAQRLSLVFDADASEEEVAALLLALSELYRALGGDGLVILDSGVPRWEGEVP